MWIVLAFISACLLGLYDVCKKKALTGNAVIPVLWINTLICTAFFLPSIIGSAAGWWSPTSALYLPGGTWQAHGLVALKACIVLASWICGYYAIRRLPLTIAGPINASRPVLVLLGAIICYGERLNAWQWGGVTLTLFSLFLLSRSSRKEGIRFGHNRHILLLATAALLGAASGLYDKYLMMPVSAGGAQLDRLFVQGWYNLYQALLMGLVFVWAWWMPRRGKHTLRAAPRGDTIFSWRTEILLISVFLTAADLAYFYALSRPGALVAVVSMVRRGSVLVSFAFGALMLRERNLKAKGLDLALVLLGMVLLYIGTR